MTVARELVTLLRYEIDDSKLREFERRRPRGAGAAPGNVPGLPAPRVIDSTSTALGRLGGIVRGLFAAISVISAARIADEWAGVQGRVSIVTDGLAEQNKALEGIYNLAQSTRQEYTAAAGLFQAVQRNAKELALGLDQSLKLTEVIGTAMTIGGGSAASQSAALMQLGQAFGTGTLRGEELNSVMEQAPRLAQAIAESFNVPVGQLKKLAEAGKLTSKELAAGLLKQSEKLREEFERMPMTFSGAWVTLSNAMGRQIDKLNRSSGAARIFYNVTSKVVDNLDKIIEYIAWIGAAAGLTKLAYMARSMSAAGGFLAATMARFGGARAFGVLVGTFVRMLAVATAIYYVFDDISVWFRGGDSMLGRLIGGMHQWQWLVDAVKNGLTFIKDLLGGSLESLESWVSKWGLIGVVVAGIVAAIGGIPALIATITIAWANVFTYVRDNWKSLIDDTIYHIGRLGSSIKNLLPGWLTSGASSIGGFFSRPGDGGAASTPIVGPGGAAFGITPSMMNRRPGAPQSVTNAPNITVNATSSEPAAVAAATARGVERGMSASSMVPQVEAAR